MTRLEEYVSGLSKELKPLSNKHYDYALAHSVKFSYMYRKHKHCSECGAIVESDKCTCGAKLKDETTNTYLGHKQYFCVYGMFNVVTVHKGFQVVRTFEITKAVIPGNSAIISMVEICQNWVNEQGKEVVIARSRNGMIDRWRYETELKLKKNNNRFYNIYHDLDGIVYNKIKVIPKLKQRGVKSSFYGANVVKAIISLLKDENTEKLLKMRQFECFRRSLYRNLGSGVMNAIRICTKHKYYISDFTLWLDNYRNLVELGKDVCSPKYICPVNLKREHEHNQKKVEEKRKKEQLERDLKEVESREEQYRKDKKKYLGICFGDGKIQIKVLQNVREFYEEGKAMHHCVFTNKYYTMKNSLIMSARDSSGNRVETIEYDLKTRKIVQSRAKCNGMSKEHEHIIELVNNNIGRVLKFN